MDKLAEIISHYEAYTTVSFPGLGISSFDLKKTFLDIGDEFSIMWYAILITTGIILAFSYAVFRGKYEKIKFDDIIDVALWTVILGIIGARAYFVVFRIEDYIEESESIGSFIVNVLNVRNGGLAIYGGIIFGILGIIIGSLIKKMNTFLTGK